MKLAHPAERHRHVPIDQLARPEAERAAYLLRTPAVYDQARLNRAVAAAGASNPSQLRIVAAARKGVEALLTDPADAATRDRFLAALDDYADRFRADPAGTFVDGHAEADAVIEAVRRGWPALAALEADRQFWREALGIESCRLFVAGGENLAFDPAPGPDGLPDAQIAAIPEDHRWEIALRVLGLLRPSQDEAKNSDSPSPGDGTPTSSTSTAAASASPKTARSASNGRTGPGRATAGSSPKSASTD